MINSHRWPPSQEEAAFAFDVLNAVVAAGLQAAARGPSSAQLNRTTRQQSAAAALLYPPTSAATTAAVTAAASSAAAAAAILGSSSSMSGQALPLTVFASSMPSAERVMLALAGLTHLTRLELRLSDKEAIRVRARAALASLTGLKELVLGQSSAEHGRRLADVEMNRSLDALHVALQTLPCLTYCDFGGVPAQRFLDVLPVGLVKLKLGSQLPQGFGAPVARQLAHLTNVTKLQLSCLLEGSVLPPLLCLLACELYSVQPLLPLRHLNQLSIWQPNGVNATIMQQLSALTQVTHFSVACSPSCGAAYASISDLPPLRKLTLITFAGYVLHQLDRRDCYYLHGSHISNFSRRNCQSGLGLGKHLTCLVLQDLELQYSAGVGSQLTELPALEELRLVRLYAQRPPGTASSSNECATVWKDLVCGVSELKSLRSFIACEMELVDAAAGLAAATQLTHCELVGCGVSEAAEAELRAGLTQLSRSRLLVR
jgi:hypothetical protein